MSNLIQIQDGSKSFGSRTLFDEATFAVNEGEHAGVIGPNGAGKTTLFKILVGDEELDSGTYVKSNRLRLGYLAQDDDWEIEINLEDFLENKCTLPIWDLKQLGQNLGLTEEHFSQPIKNLSGGYRMRSQLLYIIGCEPNLMLLDEPTNYLDLESLLILEQFLIGYSGAFLLISHDREFLRRVTNQIIEVESQEVIKYPGNIDEYFEQKALIREQLQKQNLSAEGKKKHIMNFVSRFGAKANKASQAQSKLKQLKKIKTVDIKALPITAKIRIPEPIRTGKMGLQVEDIAVGYGDTTILHKVNLQLIRGDHIGVVGINGAGKSTLLKCLAGELEPFSGKMKWGYGITTSYFAQHVSEQLEAHHSVYDAMFAKAHPDILPQDVLDLAGSLLFSNRDVDKKVSVLSGGEKARVALGQILLKRAPFLILDEPTNHLDFNTVEALTQALMKYSGTVIIVSHDRSFIGRVASKIVEIDDGHVSLYPGTYPEYVWSVENGSLQSDREKLKTKTSPPPEKKAVIENKAAPTPTGNKGNYRDTQKSLNRQVRMIDKKAGDIEKRLKSYQSKMSELSEKMSATSGKEAMDLAFEAEEVQKSIELDEYRWMELTEEKEKIEADLKGLGER